MKPRVKNGLIAGLAGLVAGAGLTIGVSGLCGPLVALLMGALAGHFTVREEHPATPREGARLGAISGATAGALMLLMGALRLLSLPAQIQALPVPPEAELSPLLYFLALSASALLVVIGLALANGLLAALAGAAAGYAYVPRPSELADDAVVITGTAVAGTLASPAARADLPRQPAIWRQGLRFGVIFGGALSLVMSFAVLSYGGAAANWVAWLFATAAYFALAVGLFTLVGMAAAWGWRLFVRMLRLGTRR